MKAKKSEEKIKKLSKPSVNKSTVKKETKVKPSDKTVKTAKVKNQPAIGTAIVKVNKYALAKRAPDKVAAVKETLHKPAKTPASDDIIKHLSAKKAAKLEKKAAKKALKDAEKIKEPKVQAKSAVKAKAVEAVAELPKTAPAIPGKRKVGRPRKVGSEGEIAPPRPKRESSPDDTSSLSKNDTMKVYMQDIGQISLVTKDEEVELAAKIHGNDPKLKEEARATLIKANLRLVVKIAHDFKGLGLPLLDLISEGNIGLMRAVEKFDPAKGAKFSSYAAWWIKQSMRRALANQSKTIRIPVQSAGKINKIKSARLKLTEKLGREPTDAEIAGFLEFSERTVAGLRLADLRTFSLHDPIQQGEDGEFQDIIPDRHASIPDRILGDLESVSRLTNLMESLDEREKMILKMRFGLDGNKPRTLEEVSQEIGRTRERVRQIQNQALTKLKSMLIDESGFVYE
ncbi:MAG: sigma-70 family RNA polymerase sigma factor [Lentisphaerota bacterium]